MPQSRNETESRVRLLPEFERRLRACLEPSFRRHRLTWQEQTLMAGIAAGLKNCELASWTGWTENTIETYCKNLFCKLAVHTRGQAAERMIVELLDLLNPPETSDSEVFVSADGNPTQRQRLG